jgi:hypothetical protein
MPGASRLLVMGILLWATLAQAELRQVDLTIFGMD